MRLDHDRPAPSRPAGPFRRGLVALALIVIALPATSSADRSEPAPNAVRTEYERLVKNGCDPKAANVATPIEARILRNTPYAWAGKIFKSPELTAIFSADGNWYKPLSKQPHLDPVDQKCILKLARWERKLRKQLPIDKKVEAVMTRDRSLYIYLRDHVQYDRKYAEAKSSVRGGVFSWGFAYEAGCGRRGKAECGGYSITCERNEKSGKMVCQVVAAG